MRSSLFSNYMLICIVSAHSSCAQIFSEHKDEYVYIVYSFERDNDDYYVCTAYNCYFRNKIFGLGAWGNYHSFSHIENIDGKCANLYKIYKKYYTDALFDVNFGPFFVPKIDSNENQKFDVYIDSDQLFMDNGINGHYEKKRSNNDIVYICCKAKADFITITDSMHTCVKYPFPSGSYWFMKDSYSYPWITFTRIYKFERLNSIELSEFGLKTLEKKGIRFFYRDH